MTRILSYALSLCISYLSWNSWIYLFVFSITNEVMFIIPQVGFVESSLIIERIIILPILSPSSTSLSLVFPFPMPSVYMSVYSRDHHLFLFFFKYSIRPINIHRPGSQARTQTCYVLLFVLVNVRLVSACFSKNAAFFCILNI
jgi:hypothetical protein